jgi:hypothetical protein
MTRSRFEVAAGMTGHDYADVVRPSIASAHMGRPRPDRHDGDRRAAHPSGAVVMAFYAAGAMPDEAQAPQLLAVVEVVDDSSARVGAFPTGSVLDPVA